MSEKWNIGDCFPAGREPSLGPDIQNKRTCFDNHAAGTPENPRIIWTCWVHDDGKGLRERVEEATEIRVKEWARRAGFSIIWILAGPHATQTMLEPDLKPQMARDPANRFPVEKRYEMADPHITIRAGVVDHFPYKDFFTCMVSGHLYVLLDRDGVPNLDRPMLEADRKFVESGDYRVDQMWVWDHDETKAHRDRQWTSLLDDGVDREKLTAVRVGFKRVRDDGEYSSYYAEHHHTCKLFKWDVNGDAVKYTKKPGLRWYVNPEGIERVETPPSGLYLPRPLLDKLKQQERERQWMLKEERRIEAEKAMRKKADEERRKKQEANREKWRRMQAQRGAQRWGR